ncbi:hypothetical protein FEM03_17120 [Phragmitibacter flavus]|uniref:Uncharacterized protein n=1 Tax=Phragmitibacter flavus TaxID=2576071 RepID=A0A5R8KBK8_9BACT|nr:hypothetical protein [Phragmitibacter flavus]TLD69676.1 hypothetical protein FEM03_17120 [Phragmitibacter flavus]
MAEEIKITRRKAFISISDELRSYLRHYGRMAPLPATYTDLMGFSSCYPLMDKDGQSTLWDSVVYERGVMEELWPRLTSIYSLLKTGDMQSVPHLYIERVDFCGFGNSKPFRIRVVNQYNDNYDHFYVKVADASRVYGLELEHLLSPNSITYLCHENTLIEEHIAGIPGDVFIKDYFDRPDVNRVRVAKEFVKFSERCFIRLLGDMRSYNYVMDMTPDFEETQYRVRAIDFDQQSYEGAKSIYLPQFYKENLPVVQMCTKYLNYATMQQYQQEERTLIARRFLAEKGRLRSLFRCMKSHPVEPVAKVEQLKRELGDYHSTDYFAGCASMGDLVEKHIEFTLGRLLAPGLATVLPPVE